MLAEDAFESPLLQRSGCFECQNCTTYEYFAPLLQFLLRALFFRPDFCQAGLRRGGRRRGTESLLLSVERTVNEAVARMSDRLAKLLARTAIESSATRKAQNIYKHLEGAPEATIREVNDLAWQRAVKMLKERHGDIHEVAAALSYLSYEVGSDE